MPSYRVGNVEILPLLDTRLAAPPQFLLPQVAATYIAEFGDSLNDGMIGLSISSFVVRSGGKTYIVDTGAGNIPRDDLPPGSLDQELKSAGIAPSDIDVVIHTHLHGDHVGWNVVRDGNGDLQPFFPNAVHYIQQKEWDFWMAPEKLAGTVMLRDCVIPLAGFGKVKFQSAEAAIDENLVFVPTPGHTPAHVSVGIASGGERAIIAGDVSHFPAQLQHPDWSPVFDLDPALAAETRAKVFETCESEARTWFAGHYPFPGAGRIVRLEGKRVFQAL